MSKRRRDRVIDRAVQMTLVMRIVVHWLLFLVVAIFALSLFKLIFLADVSVPLSKLVVTAGLEAVALLVVFLALLPCFVVDTLKLSHRFCGPMYRLHDAIRSLARGTKPGEIRFRKGDFWHEVAEDFNAALSRLECSGESKAEPSHESDNGFPDQPTDCVDVAKEDLARHAGRH